MKVHYHPKGVSGERVDLRKIRAKSRMILVSGDKTNMKTEQKTGL